MKKIIKLTLFAFLVLVFASISSFSFSQNGIDASNGYIGYSTFTPRFKIKQEVESVNDWKGFEVSLGDFVYSHHTGEVRIINADSTIGSAHGKLFNVGYRLGWDLNLGNTSLTSVGIKPFVQFNFPVTSISKTPIDNSISSIGIGLGGGVAVRFSQFYVVGRYDVSTNMNTAWFGDNKRFNAATGYVGGLNLTVGIDNAFDLLNPRIFKMKGLIVKMKTKEYYRGEHYDSKRGQWYKEYLTVTTTTKTPGEKISTLFDAFWGIGPTYTFNSVKKRQAASSLQGLNFGIRAGYIMLDGFYEKGELGLQDPLTKEDILIAFPRLRNFDFSSKIAVEQYGGRLGFNLSKMIKYGDFETSYQNTKSIKSMVPFVRFSGFLALGKANFSGSPDYTFENGNEMLTTYQELNDIVADKTNNPNYLPETSNFTGWGISLEFGSAFINKTWYKYKDAPAADMSTITVGANIPLGRMYRHSRAKFAIKRRFRKGKRNDK